MSKAVWRCACTARGWWTRRRSPRTRRIGETVNTAADDAALAEFATALQAAQARAADVTVKLGQTALQGQVERALANATIYLDMLGHIVIAWLWLQQAQTAARAPNTSE